MQQILGEIDKIRITITSKYFELNAQLSHVCKERKNEHKFVLSILLQGKTKYKKTTNTFIKNACRVISSADC